MADLLDQKIRQRTIVFAPPERVFETLTSDKEWNSFFTTGMELEPRVGGVCSFAWENWGPDNYTLKVPGRVVEFDPPRVFAFQWGREGKETTVRFELAEGKKGTIITTTEEGYRDTPEDRAMIMECASGWGEAVTLLKFYIEHGLVYDSAINRSE